MEAKFANLRICSCLIIFPIIIYLLISSHIEQVSLFFSLINRKLKAESLNLLVKGKDLSCPRDREFEYPLEITSNCTPQKQFRKHIKNFNKTQKFVPPFELFTASL